MTPLIHTSGGKAADPSQSTWTNSAASGSTTTKGFDALLSMLTSIIGGGGVSTSKAKAKTSGKTGRSDNSADPKGRTSANEQEKSALSNLEEQLLEIITSGKIPAKGKGNSGNKTQSAAIYAIAGMPVVGVQQLTKDPENTVSPASSAASATKEETSSVLAMLGRDISAYLKAAADQSDSGEGQPQKAVANDVHSTVDPKKAGSMTQDQAVQKDLLKLLSASNTGKVDAKVLKELSAFMAERDQRVGAVAKETTQNLKGDPQVAAASGKTEAVPNNMIRPSGSPAQGGIRLMKDDPGGAIVVDSKSGSANSSSKSNSQKSQINGVVDPKTKSVEVKGTPAEQGNNTAASQATSSNQPTAADNGKAGTDQAVSSQSIQAQPARSNQGGQNSLDSGKNQQDTSNFGPAQVYTAPANSNPSASFVQTLSAAPQNLTNVTATINLSQLAQGIVKHVSMMTQEGKKIVNMKLEPESLGSVSLQVVSDGGKISAQFNVGTTDARAFLESSMSQMRQMLESNGVSLAHLSVNLSGGESQSRNPQYQYKPRKHNWKYFSDPAKGVVSAGSSEMSRSFGYNTMEMQA